MGKMDLASATADEVLAYHSGFRAARMGLPLDLGSPDPWWLTGWRDEMLSQIQFLRLTGDRRANNDN